MNSEQSEYECGYQDGHAAGTMMAILVSFINAVGWFAFGFLLFFS
jgi:hypothetical protein